MKPTKRSDPPARRPMGYPKPGEIRRRGKTKSGARIWLPDIHANEKREERRIRRKGTESVSGPGGQKVVIKKRPSPKSRTKKGGERKNIKSFP